ncbi:MAG: GGDEF and EAL domain-containing protein, partial [Oscillospiraceae bacterium]|nr:GGDEF and EAL domain-containing protein [Oscillospiraceae bacterium]
KNTFFPVEQFRSMMRVLSPCMDNYLFIYNLQNHHFEISSRAVDRFCIPSHSFVVTSDLMERLIFEKDIPLLLSDFEEIKEHKKYHHDMEYRWMDADGQPVWINCRGRILVDEANHVQFLVGCINEIGRRQRADNISGLLAVSSIKESLQDKLHPEQCGFLMRLDIDDFHEINEKMGMEFGDMILRETAECINSILENGQSLYHITADEFAVLDLVSKTPEDTHNLYRNMRKRIDQYIADKGYRAFFTISAGVVAIHQAEDRNFSTLMTLAEFSLNEAKNRGKNTDYLYDPADYQVFLRRKMLLHTLRQAVLQDFEGFDTHFQPVEDLQEHALCGAETLLRFNSEATGSVSPVEFIPLLEESGLIIPVGRWVLHEAMKFCKKMQVKIPDFTVSVNISYVQVLKSDILKDISDGLKQHGLTPGSIQVELTESGMFESDKNYSAFCTGLKELGIPLALDDFGTGYSNFHYLYHINPQVIKIDRSFTLKALRNEYEFNLLHHMVELTHSINSKLCIEGIETQEELDKICTLNPDYIQGYYFGKTYPGPMFLAEYVNS